MQQKQSANYANRDGHTTSIELTTISSFSQAANFLASWQSTFRIMLDYKSTMDECTQQHTQADSISIGNSQHQ